MLPGKAGEPPALPGKVGEPPTLSGNAIGEEWLLPPIFDVGAAFMPPAGDAWRRLYKTSACNAPHDFR